MTTEKTSPHLVIVDDDIDIQDLVTAFFKPRGFRVTAFSTAEEALVASKSQCDSWDVLLTDLRLPQMSGIDFIAEMKKIREDLPIILVTITKSAETAVKAIHQGAYDFIVKPIHFPQLQVSVERALHYKSLQMDIVELRSQVKAKETSISKTIIGKSPKFLSAIEIARRVASSQANIFITGESGTGKEVFAKFIHAESPRSKGPFVAINCSAIPENLLESELFGHAKGAFTGAQDKKIGLFEEAENGTLFLDEIGDLSTQLQAKLLRVVQERKIKRVGENQYRAVNARIISATHKNLVEEIAAARFREDLFFRLNVIPIHIPPLRERPEDILPLAESFLKKYALINGSPAKTFSKDATKFLLENHWKGNVRELENSVERAVVMATDPQIEASNFLLGQVPSFENALESHQLSEEDFHIKYSGKLLTVEEIVQRYIEYAVDKNGGAKDKTAKELDIDRKTLYKRFKQIQAQQQEAPMTM